MVKNTRRYPLGKSQEIFNVKSGKEKLNSELRLNL